MEKACLGENLFFIQVTGSVYNAVKLLIGRAMATDYLPRTLEAFIAKTSNQFPVLMLSGPRQVGKTTLLKALCQRESVAAQPRRFVSPDNPKLLSFGMGL